MTQRCRVCGCTNLFGCDEGCWWVEDDLCSRCGPCPHPDWRINHYAGGEPIDGPFGAQRLTPICTECGAPVQVGAAHG